MAVGGIVLRSTSTLVRLVQFLAAILILGIFSYFLATLAKDHLSIATYIKAVEGISGAAVIYSAFAVILTCFLGGITFFAFLAILLDICFIGGFVAIAVLTRAGARSCSGTVSTPLGNGNAASHQSDLTGGSNTTYRPNLGVACKLQKAVFAVAIAAAVLFLISAVLQLLLGKHHKKEKRYGPGPSNNYTSGSGSTKKPFWKRNKKTTRDAELGAVGAGAVLAADHHHKQNNTFRPSNDTGLTGSTAAPSESRYGGSDPTTQKPNGSHLYRGAEMAALGGGALGAEKHHHQNQNVTGSHPHRDAELAVVAGGAERHHLQDKNVTGPSHYSNAGSNAPVGGMAAPSDPEYVGYEPPEHRHYGGLPHLEPNHSSEHTHATGQGNPNYGQATYGRAAY